MVKACIDCITVCIRVASQSRPGALEATSQRTIGPEHVLVGFGICQVNFLPVAQATRKGKSECVDYCTFGRKGERLGRGGKDFKKEGLYFRRDRLQSRPCENPLLPKVPA